MMANDDIFVISADDWSVIDGKKTKDEDLCRRMLNKAAVAEHIDECRIDEFGLYCKEDTYHTSGYVGIDWLRDGNGQPVQVEGKSAVIAIYPRFKELDPWEMLIAVLQDDEYSKYVASDPNRFFKIMYEQPIPASVEQRGGELLLVLSYLRCLQGLCRKKLSRKIQKAEGNFNGNVHGNIKIRDHIVRNSFQGRDDRIYCRYTKFGIDTTENRILKAALKVCKDILVREKIEIEEVGEMIRFCESSLIDVKEVKVKKSDFSMVDTTGFNSKYKEPISLAKNLIEHFALNIQESSDEINTVIPYMIKMEALFEFFIRAKIRKYLNRKNEEFGTEKYILDDYREQGDENALRTYRDSVGEVYLQSEYIPDILIKEKVAETTYKNIVVFDAKYQHSIKGYDNDSRRHNSHQLLSYSLLLNVEHCGFIFPYEEKHDCKKTIIASVWLQEGTIKGVDRKYSQWYINNFSSPDEDFERMLSYVMA